MSVRVRPAPGRATGTHSQGELMEAKHTPGPWHVEQMDYLTVFAEDDREKYCGRPVAIIRHSRVLECDADARLIAAAPELLEALTKVRTWLIAPNTSDESLDEMTSIVKSAITKALGE